MRNPRMPRMRFTRLCLFVSFAILSLCNAADAGAVLQVGGSVSGGLSMDFSIQISLMASKSASQCPATSRCVRIQSY